MDGEAILANQTFDDMDVAALEAELNRLKEPQLHFMSIVVLVCKFVGAPQKAPKNGIGNFLGGGGASFGLAYPIL